ncbi:MAG: sigma-70 family RNA polymerase sigma factor [Saprospiraceae bacterium]|nr:MAG: sigma-70 family RNA polymerase sigma factor [Bacteroidetes bacterium OLB9]MCO6464259.1 sigma-70 family RNA polymerase sigma factor [Saprospiraceae bacterium]MCZ2338897.1 sigma-70 family RNA polymerase sigma factor [Chitinophagales bacterium]
MKRQESEIDPTEEDLIEKILAGNRTLYEIIVHRYNSYLYKVGRSYGFNHDDVEDLLQDTYISAFQHLKDFNGRSSLKTWLVHILLHQCYHKKHKMRYSHEKPVSEEINNDKLSLISDKRDDGFSIVQSHELREIIESAVLQLPDEYRDVFSLRELYCISTAETATVLNITESNVKIRLKRAKEMLKSRIKQSFNSSELFELNLVHCGGIQKKTMDAVHAI